MSSSSTPGEPSGSSGITREGIIRAVQTPLGLFALVVLAVEAILGGLAALSDESNRTIIIVGMFVFFGSLIVIVSVLAYFRPEAVGGTRLPPENDLNARRSLAPVAPVSNLPKPGAAPGTIGFLSPQPIDARKNEVIRRVVRNRGGSEAEASPWSFHEVYKLADLDDDGLDSWRGIFFAMPYGQIFSPTLIARLVRWVHKGGNMVVTGFELGERHHRTNINQLLSRQL
jgi:hypothetical protein